MHERRDNVLGTDVLGNFRLALECANLNFPTLETFEMALMRSFKLLLTHDTPGVDSHQASAAYTHMIEEISDLVLQASGLGQEPRPDQLGQIQQDEAIPRGRGRPQQVSGTQLWSSLLLCALQGMHSFADWRRLLGLQSIGPFAPLWLTRNGLVKRLLQAGLIPLQEVWEVVNARLAL